MGEKLSLEEAQKAAGKAQGYLSVAEGKLLYSLANRCTGRGAIVEIGSWKGRSTIWIGFGSKDGCKAIVFAVDPHTSSPEMPQGNSFREFRRNIENAGLEKIVKPLVKTSEDAAKDFRGKAEFVFIDGDHSYAHARQDFELWFPKVLEQGTMAFHDTMLVPGPRKVVKEKVFFSRHFRNAGFADSITFAQKVSQNTFAERLHNYRVFALKEFFTLVSRINIAAGLPKQLKAAGKKILKAVQ